jgi:hypothetical protein
MYVGTFRNGSYADGEGTGDWNNNSVYTGPWKNGKPNGNGGSYSKADPSSIYNGSWVDGQRSGQGVWQYPSNTGNYTGSFKDGARDG